MVADAVAALADAAAVLADAAAAEELGWECDSSDGSGMYSNLRMERTICMT